MTLKIKGPANGFFFLSFQGVRELLDVKMSKRSGLTRDQIAKLFIGSMVWLCRMQE